ncbi:NAD(P)/FAD-dependent oxidoreductase [Xanthobacter autotrophicus]|uniref:NAD(P)/FAD-dependent oxidoreductase n=1 Tax=Xanthobacter autotrophicus TaxID=280 RepID=UPI0024A70E0A|nr:NAD(P)/FAD-dependent oxidoreductase [Xanthobacter autotrophicus]MDI4656045.1 NAD(P)/FAD-dependent oxidoreductase [Xanthobacter autotrophicus]
MFDAVIIGGGPAGASCALWLKMLGFRPCIVERRQVLGGLQNDNPYPNKWMAPVRDRTGFEVAAEIHRHVMEHDIVCRLGESVTALELVEGGFRITTAGGETLLGRACVLASGVRPVKGGFTESHEVIIGPGRTMFNAVFERQSVAILGGGDNAFENYIFVRKRGAERITLFARTIRARREFLEKVPPADVRIGAYPVAPEIPEVAGRRFDRIVVLYGWEPYLPYARHLNLARDPRGFVETSADCETAIPDLYAIGEIAQRMHPCCATSMADGVVAAKAIQRSLEQDAVARFAERVRRAAASDPVRG